MKKKVLAVMGSTAVGKSKLAIDLAKALQAEVINCDALQIYDSMPVSTNKVTSAEMEGVPHHLMSYLTTIAKYKDQPTSKDYTVVDFVHDAREQIDNIELPIVVGGTHYWLQQLLFEDLELETVLRQRRPDPELMAILQSNDNEAILNKLKQVDPVMAYRWHPNDHRKIRRSLEVYAETSQPQSKLLQDQQARYQARNPSIIFWLYTQPKQLESRTSRRIEDMFTRGLLQEVMNAYDLLAYDREVDFTYGVYQGIGLKEMYPYLQRYRYNIQISNDGFDSNVDSCKERSKLWKECVERMKINTRVLAKTQVKWIRSKVLPACANKVPVFMFEVDQATIDDWQTKVVDPALEIVRKFLANQELPDVRAPEHLQNLLQIPKDKDYNSSRVTSKLCDICKVPVIMSKPGDFDVHLQSRKHRAQVQKPLREEKLRKIKELYHQ